MARKFETRIKTRRSELAQRVLRLRRFLGWSQAQLAQEFYVTPSTVAHWESDNRAVSGPAIKLIEIYEDRSKLTEVKHA